MIRRELDQRTIRRRKLRALRARGVDPYPATVERTTTIAHLRRTFPGAARPVTIVGRLRSLRWHGGSSFGDLEDGTDRIQLYLQRDVLGTATYDQWLAGLDRGDFVEAAGETMVTRRGEPTVRVRRLRLLAKTLQPLPEKRHGLSDVEVRYRHRELDLLANPATKTTFVTRAAILRAVRHFLDERGFLEVETPVLQPIAGGTIARPFVTRHAALNHDFFLRIAPELYLKRLIVGGYERVYEIARCFRNEGIDHTHNPEFTMIELYAAYADHRWLMTFTEELVSGVVRTVHDRLTIPYGQASLDFAPPYRRLTYAAALTKAGTALAATDAALKRFARAKKLALPARARRGHIFEATLKTLVFPGLVQPTFLTGHPVELSPLAKEDPAAPQTTLRLQLIVAGFELVNAYAELNDPEEQRARFATSTANRKHGEPEAHPDDPDFLAALEVGLPPTAGWGMGLDRFAMLLTNRSAIKEVLLFPTLKPSRR